MRALRGGLSLAVRAMDSPSSHLFRSEQHSRARTWPGAGQEKDQTLIVLLRIVSIWGGFFYYYFVQKLLLPVL